MTQCCILQSNNILMEKQLKQIFAFLKLSSPLTVEQLKKTLSLSDQLIKCDRLRDAMQIADVSYARIPPSQQMEVMKAYIATFLDAGAVDMASAYAVRCCNNASKTQKFEILKMAAGSIELLQSIDTQEHNHSTTSCFDFGRACYYEALDSQKAELSKVFVDSLIQVGALSTAITYAHWVYANIRKNEQPKILELNERLIDILEKAGRREQNWYSCSASQALWCYHNAPENKQSRLFQTATRFIGVLERADCLTRAVDQARYCYDDAPDTEKRTFLKIVVGLVEKINRQSDISETKKYVEWCIERMSDSQKEEMKMSLGNYKEPKQELFEALGGCFKSLKTQHHSMDSHG